jgi:phosphinothricin acetyltransferase
MSEFVVRPSTPEDFRDITRIYSHYVLNSSATFELEPPDRDEMARRRSDILALGLPYLTAEVDGAVAGYAYAHLYRPRAAYKFTVEDSIYVAPEYAGRGCGRALLTSLIEQCGQGHWRQLIAVIGGSANAASIALHLRLGFHPVGTLCSVGFKFNRWVDSVLMQRALGPESVHENESSSCDVSRDWKTGAAQE